MKLVKKQFFKTFLPGLIILAIVFSFFGQKIFWSDSVKAAPGTI